MYIIGIILLVVNFLAVVGLVAVIENDGSDSLCGVLIITIAITCLMGPILLSQGSYERGYEQGILDFTAGDVSCDTVTTIKIITN